VAKDTISFALGSGTPSIPAGFSSGTALPPLTHPVVIDGSSGGATRVELNGNDAGANANGLTLSGGSSTISDLVINRFTGDGIRIDTSGGNRVQGNRIGTEVTGGATVPNSRSGVLVSGGLSNVVGGTVAGARNLISGNAEHGLSIVDRSRG